jgi:2-methylcitrate dehydratase
MVKAYEIQGCFQIRNAFNIVGLDHTILVKIASTAVCSWLLGLDRFQAFNAVSQAWADSSPLRIYRQSPNTGPRKGWAAGDACMRAVHLALLARCGQPGIPTVLSQPRWGFYDALFRGAKFELPRPFETWVMDNVIFKVNTAEGHGLSAVEAAVIVAEQLKSKSLILEDIDSVHVRTQEAGKIIIDKPSTTLRNAADRDHSMQFMVAATMVKGTFLETGDYQDHSVWVDDERVKHLMDKVTVSEDLQFTRDYHDPEVRSCANAISVVFKNGFTLPDVTVQFPLGHPKRAETADAVRLKAGRNLSLCLPSTQVEHILRITQSPEFLQMPVTHFGDLLVPEPV